MDFVSQGRTQEEAKKNLLEVIRIQFKEMRKMRTLEEYLQECGFDTKDDEIVPKTEMVGLEKSVVLV